MNIETLDFTELFDTSLTLITKLDTIRKSGPNELRELDKQVSHIYHMIEMVPLNAAQLAKVTKKLKEVLKERRTLKDQISHLDSFFQSPTDKLSALSQSKKQKDIDSRNAGYAMEAKANFELLFATK